MLVNNIVLVAYSARGAGIGVGQYLSLCVVVGAAAGAGGIAVSKWGADTLESATVFWFCSVIPDNIVGYQCNSWQGVQAIVANHKGTSVFWVCHLG